MPILDSFIKSKDRISRRRAAELSKGDRLLAFSGPAEEGDEDEDESRKKMGKFDQASHALQLATVPKSLPCREE
eukprot:2095996-Rhodomonas_salina.1